MCARTLNTSRHLAMSFDIVFVLISRDALVTRRLW